MSEPANPIPTPEGYAAEGRELEAESLAGTYPVSQAIDDEARGFALQAQALSDGEPARTAGEPIAAAEGDPSEMLGEVLQSQELNPAEPAVTNEPVPFQPAASATAYVAEGCALEQDAVTQAHPGQPVAPQQAAVPYYAAPSGYAPQTSGYASQAQSQAAAAQSAYQAAYGAPATSGAPTAGPVPYGAPTRNSQAAATAAALQKTRSSVDPYRVFLICGMVVGAVMIVFGLCMLAFYTPSAVSDFYNSSALGGQSIAAAGATAAQVLKAGFSLLLIGLGATDICAFGAKFAKRSCKGRAQR